MNRFDPLADATAAAGVRRFHTVPEAPVTDPGKPPPEPPPGPGDMPQPVDDPPPPEAPSPIREPGAPPPAVG